MKKDNSTAAAVGLVVSIHSDSIDAIYELILKSNDLEYAKKKGLQLCKIAEKPYFYTIKTMNNQELYRHVKR